MKKADVEKARNTSLTMLQDAGIVLAEDEEIEITDFGKGKYNELGLGLIIRVSEPEYGSKWLTVQPGQFCPNHYHKYIKESFFIIKGDVTMWVNDDVVEMKPGDKVTMPEGTWHKFTSKTGAIIEEITTEQIADDSIFEDQDIQRYITVEDE